MFEPFFYTCNWVIIGEKYKTHTHNSLFSQTFTKTTSELQEILGVMSTYNVYSYLYDHIMEPVF